MQRIVVPWQHLCYTSMSSIKYFFMIRFFQFKTDEATEELTHTWLDVQHKILSKSNKSL